jgi:cell division protein FtsA
MLNEIIEARVEEIFSLIDKEIRISEYYDKLSGVVMVGGGMALINGVEKIGKNILGKLVRTGIPKYIGASSPLYATAVGVVRDVSDSMKLKNSMDMDLSKDDDLPDYKKIIEDEDEKEKEDKGNRFISKIKDFFTDFF